jgi:hypothetical protein
MDFKLGAFSKFLLGGLGALTMLIGPIVAFVMFLAGISGMGNKPLVWMALVVLVASLALPPHCRLCMRSQAKQLKTYWACWRKAYWQRWLCLSSLRRAFKYLSM